MDDPQTTIQKAYRAFNERKIPGALVLMTEDVRWPKASEGGDVVGKQELGDYWTRQWHQYDPHVEPMEIAGGNDGKFRVTVHQVVKDRKGELLSDSMVLHIITFSDGLISAMTLGDGSNADAGPTRAFSGQP